MRGEEADGHHCPPEPLTAQSEICFWAFGTGLCPGRSVGGNSDPHLAGLGREEGVKDLDLPAGGESGTGRCHGASGAPPIRWRTLRGAPESEAEPGTVERFDLRSVGRLGGD